MDDSKFSIWGGTNYAQPQWDDESEHFDTLEAAVNEWCRRRNDWTGRFPLWGDMDEGPDTYTILLGDEAESWDAWSIRAALTELGRADELIHYFDEVDA